jgi:hypothetical protein
MKIINYENSRNPFAKAKKRHRDQCYKYNEGKLYDKGYKHGLRPQGSFCWEGMFCYELGVARGTEIRKMQELLTK